MSESAAGPERLDLRIRRIAFFGRLVVATTVLWVVAQAVVTVAALNLGESWVAAYQADPNSDPMLGGYNSWAIGEVAVMIFAWIATSIWLWQVRTNAELVDPHSQTLSRSFVATGWVAPIFMLWTPYEAVTDAAVPTVRVTQGRAAASDLPVLLRLWWGSYLVTLLVTVTPHGYTLGDRDHLAAVYRMSLVATAVTVVSAVLWVRVVRKVTAAQADVRVLAEAVETVRQAEAARP